MAPKHGHAGGKLQAMLRNPDVEVVGVFEPDAEQRAKLQAGSGTLRRCPLVRERGRNAERREHRRNRFGRKQRRKLGSKRKRLSTPASTSGMINPLAKTGGSGSASSAPQMTNRCWCRWGICCAITQPSSKWRSGCTLASSAMYSRCGHTCPQTSRTKHARASVNTSAASSFDLGGHVLDQVLWLLGRPEKVTAFLRNDGGSVEPFKDNTLTVYEFEKAMAFISISALEPRPMARRFEVYGTEGSAIILETVLSRGSKFGFVWRRRRGAMPKANRLSK